MPDGTNSPLREIGWENPCSLEPQEAQFDGVRSRIFPVHGQTATDWQLFLAERGRHVSLERLTEILQTNVYEWEELN